MTQLPDTTTEAGQREASVMLAQLCGWFTKDNAFYNYRPPSGKGASINHKKGYSAVDIFRPIPNGASCPTLYDPANMALAARVLHFVRDRHDDFKMTPKVESTIAWFFAYAEDGVRVALDGVLTLADSAGMLEAQP